MNRHCCRDFFIVSVPLYFCWPHRIFFSISVRAFDRLVYITVYITLFLTVNVECTNVISFFPVAIPLEFFSLLYVYSGSPVWTALIKFYKALKIRQKMSNDFSHSATALSFYCLKEHSIEFHAWIIVLLI